MEIERRVVTLDDIKLEKREDGARKIIGHAAVFNQLSEDLGGFREQIAAGAFAEAIEKDDVRALFNHNPDFILGRNLAGTLRLKEDARGLAIEIDPPDTQVARDLIVSMERGDVSQMSFGFSVRPNGQNWAKDDAGQVVRTLTKVRLFDVSPVVYPAYPQTDVAMRELRGWLSGQEKRGEGPAFKVGDRITVIGDPHMPGQSGGEVREAVLTYVYGIAFDGMDGVHKWYIESELQPDGGEENDGEENGKNKKKKMPGMQMNSSNPWRLKLMRRRLDIDPS